MMILCDVDGVLADFKGRVLDLIHERTGVRHGPEEVTQYRIEKALGLSPEVWRDIVSSIVAPGFAEDLAPCPGAIQAVKELAMIAEVVFVTAPWWSSPTWVHDRTAWLCHHFGQTQGRKVIPTHLKHMIRGDMFIDDKVEAVEAWAAANPGESCVCPVLWAHPYNAGKSPRFATRTNDWKLVRHMAEAWPR